MYLFPVFAYVSGADIVALDEHWCCLLYTSSLKRLITALENNDYVTGVETLENGYKITSVSYTHLDVYKRQAVGRAEQERVENLLHIAIDVPTHFHENLRLFGISQIILRCV